MEEMEASGELRDVLSAGASGREAQPGEGLEDRLRALTLQADVVLFMKASLRLPHSTCRVPTDGRTTDVLESICNAKDERL